MNKEVKYNGLTTVPSDYECGDGDLAAVLNLVPEDGSLKPVQPPTTLMTLAANQRIVYIHKTSAFTHYIIYDSSTYKFSWVDVSDDGTPTSSTTTSLSSSTFTNLSHVNAVGNTLLVFVDGNDYVAGAIHYFLWKNKTDGYAYLGTHLPDIAISFGLVGHPKLYSQITEDGSSSKRGTFSISFNKIGKNDFNNTFTDENKSKITSQVMAKLNKFIAEQTVNKGRFCFPFFIRWAFRLYDGSHTCQSAPILMNPSTSPAPVVIWKRATGKDGYTDADLDIMLVAADIDYRLMTYGDSSDLDDWEDIISAIDIYISKPIYTYDQSGECTGFYDSDNLNSKFIGRLYNGDKDTDSEDTTFPTSVTEDRILAPIAADDDGGYDFLEKYMEWSYDKIYCLYFSSDRTYPSTTLHLPEFSENKNEDTIESNANFYKLCSLDLDEVIAAKSKRTKIEVEEDYLQSLVNRETLDDDYLSHDKLSASYSYAFNSRLNLSGVKRSLYAGFIPQALFAYCECFHSFNIDKDTKKVTIECGSPTYKLSITVYIKENGNVYSVLASPEELLPMRSLFLLTYTRIVYLSDGRYTQILYDDTTGTITEKKYNSSGNLISTTTKSGYSPTSWGAWVFYPNPNAYKMVIRDWFDLFVIDLKTHEFLNGAYAFLGYETGRPTSTATLPTVTDRTGIVSVPNKIYTSEVNNPFYFPLSGINTVGTGNIIGICSAVKALSQGQFGQFPLYAFTDEGVWALEVSTTGTYSAKQPITRDVCINAASLTQIDTAVLFATDRGIMLIEGSQTTCLSDILNGDNLLSVASLPKMKQVAALSGFTVDDFSLLPFGDFIKNCRMIYDYAHQRIIVYNPSCTYAYIYSLKSKQWGMMQSTVADNVNSYPDALAVLADGTLVNFSVDADSDYKGILVTRPMKLDVPDVHKTVNTVIQRGFFRKGHVRGVLYASNDLMNWFVVWSSTDHYMRGFSGSPYKYFRLALLCDLADDENLSGCTVQYTPRLTNRTR